MPRNTNRTLDTLLQLKDAGAVITSAAAQVGGSAKVVDLGSGRVDAIVIIDVTAIVVTTDEIYDLYLEGSNDIAFGSGVVPLGNVNLGHATPNQGTAAETVGRYELHFTNERDDVIYRYVRMFHKMAGTAESINYTAFIAKH